MNIDFVAIDVANDPGGREQHQALGVRSLPIVFKDGEFIRGQNLEDVAKFVGLHGSGLKALPPQELIEKWMLVLRAAQRYVRQLSDQQLAGRVIDNRDRAIWRLCHHIFRIGGAFLEVAENGVDFVHQLANAEPAPGTCTTSEELDRFGDSTIARLEQWWNRLDDKSCGRIVQTYFGELTLHLLFERCTWHSAQHTRQLLAVIERLGLEPHGPLTRAHLAGLPLPERLWE